MEIERKYVVINPPENYQTYPNHEIEQAYLNTHPVVRIRRQDDDYFLTYKSHGLLSREEYNLPLNQDSYLHLRSKADNNVISKTRYLLPVSGREDLTIELDEFHGSFEGLMLAEVEFASEEDALSFVAPEWFYKDVTFSGEYQNSRLSRLSNAEISDLLKK